MGVSPAVPAEAPGMRANQPKSAWARSAPPPSQPVFSAMRNGHGCLKPLRLGVVCYTAKTNGHSPPTPISHALAEPALLGFASFVRNIPV